MVMKFWKKYYESDILDRIKITRKLAKFPLIRETISMYNDKRIPPYIKNQSLATLFQGYFDDLIEYMETRPRRRTIKARLK
jgi:hypothetical protein